MEVTDLNIEAQVVVPPSVSMDGTVRINGLNAGITKIIINDVEQPIDHGAVSFYVPEKVSDLQNDEDFTPRNVVTEMISTALEAFQEKLYVTGETLIVP